MTTREQWLLAAIDKLRPLLKQAGAKVPKDVMVSVGFPASGARTTGAECWKTRAAGGVNQIFITPRTQDPIAVLAFLAHELIHASDNCESQHGGHFRKVWTALEFEGKPTGSDPGPALREALKEVAEELGPYPHREVSLAGRAKQSTRLLKLECSECGCIIRTTAKWTDEYAGNWPCPCGGYLEKS
jgi:hypothetical protein